MEDIKDQLKQLNNLSLSSITLVITEIKAAYDNYNNQAVDCESDDGSEAAEFDPSSSDDADVLEEPPKKKAKGDCSWLQFPDTGKLQSTRGHASQPRDI